MKKLIYNNNTILIFRIILGSVFIYASLDKIQDPDAFSALIDNYRATPIWLNNLVALILPWIELICGILIIFGVFIPVANLLIFAMLILFVILLSQAVVRGIDTHCGCFKIQEGIENVDFRKQLIRRIIEDLILLAMSFVVLLKSFNLLGEKNENN